MPHWTQICLLCIVFWLGTGFSQPEGVRFFTGTWAEVQAEARRQQKPIFLTVSASWCPSCRRMAREGLVSPTVGAAYNYRFLNYQLDANLGEGPAIARQYGVVSYPTALFLTPDGQLMHGAGWATANEPDTLRATAASYTNEYIGDLTSYLSLTQHIDFQV